MKPHLLPLIFCFFIVSTLWAQCPEPSSSARLDVNNVDVLIQNGGDLGWDLIGYPQYEIPKGSGKNALFVQSIWVGGLTAANELQVAAIRFRQNGFDYSPGPLDANGDPLTNNCAGWNRIFSMTQVEIDDFKNNGTVSNGIIDWPAKSSASDPNLAPFVDVNNDGVYNYADGDYPKIKGDKAIWYVINDVGNVHTESGGSSIGIEIQVMAYAYQSSDDINNITFYDYTLTKKTPGDLSDSYVGFFTDVDLGNPQDDYVACKSSKNLGIGFNGDQIDEDNGGALGYGVNPPAMGFQFLRTPLDGSGNELGMTSFMYFNNNTTVTGDPQQDTEYYHYMSAKWRDGTALTLGGNGYDTLSTNYYNYMFDLDAPVNWSECSAANTPFDRRFVMSTGPSTLNQGVPVHLTTAIIWKSPETHNFSCDSLDDLVATADKVQSFYTNTIIASTKEHELEPKTTFSIFPNPSNGTVFLRSEYLIGKEIIISNIHGKQIAKLVVSSDKQRLPELSPGVYFISNSKNDKAETKKLIIHH